VTATGAAPAFYRFPAFVNQSRAHLASSPIRRAAPATQRSDRSLQLALTAAQIAEENRGRDLVILDMRTLTSIFDFFVLATGTSRRQMHAISEEIDRTLQETLGDRRLGIEGYVEGRWILLDYGDVVIHLFDEEAREFYALEHLWCGAKRIERPPTIARPPENSSPS
jgi:ribosome-associated protein